MCSIDGVYLQEVARTDGVSLQLLVAASTYLSLCCKYLLVLRPPVKFLCHILPL